MANPVLVQSKSGTISSSGSLTITLTSNTTAGNCLVVCVMCGSNDSTVFTVSGITLGGSAGNFAKAAGNNSTGGGNSDTEIWTDQNCAGGQTSVVITASGTALEMCAWVMEWSGILTTAAVDKTNSTNTASNTWTSGATGTLSQSNELVVGVVGEFWGGSLTYTGPSSPWTNLTQLSQSSQAYLLAGYQVVSATTAQTYNGTATGFGSGAAVVASLKGTAATTVNLPVAQVNVAAPAPTVTESVHLPVAQVTARAYPVIAGEVLPLPVARVTVSAPAPAVVFPGGVSLPVAQVTITAPAPTPTVVPTVYVNLPVARLAVSAPAPKVTIARNLLVSIASKAGTDDYGNTFPQGLQVGSDTAGSQVQILPGSAPGHASEVSFPIPGTTMSNIPNVAVGPVGSGANLLFSGPAMASPDGDWVQLVMYSNDEIGDEAHMEFRYVDTSGGAHVVATFNGSGWTFNVPVTFGAAVTFNAGVSITGGLTVDTINGSNVTGGPNGTGFFDTTGLASGSYGSTHQHTLPSFPTSTHNHNV